MSLINLSVETLTNYMNSLENRVTRLEQLVSGEQVGTARIQDAAITNAKIVSLVANKITAGDFIVAIDVGTPSSGYLRIDGANNRILGYDGTSNVFALGEI